MRSGLLPVKVFFQAYQALSASERLRFSLVLAGRVLVQALDLLGIALIGFLAAGLAGALDGETNTSFLQFSIDMSNPVFYAYGVLAIVFFSPESL